MRAWLSENRLAAGISVGILAVVVVLVAVSLRRKPPVTFASTDFKPREVGDSTVGPVRVTIDATDPDRWVFFDFSRGAVIEDPGPAGWDLGFRRFDVTVNGGDGFAGRGGARTLPASTLDSVAGLPSDGYETTDARRDSTNPVIDRWYDYGFTSHLLTPKPVVYAVRTADGRYAALRFLSYYCPGARPGCVSFEYVYVGGE